MIKGKVTYEVFFFLLTVIIKIIPTTAKNIKRIPTASIFYSSLSSDNPRKKNISVTKIPEIKIQGLNFSPAIISLTTEKVKTILLKSYEYLATLSICLLFNFIIIYYTTNLISKQDLCQKELI